MPTTIDALDLQVKSDSTQAAKGLDSLADSLGRLKAATQGGLGLNAVISQLNQLKQAQTDDATITRVTKLAEALSKLSGLGQLKISASIANQINKIGDAIRNLPGADKLTETANAIEKLNGTKGISMPTVSQNITPTATTTAPISGSVAAVKSDIDSATSSLSQYNMTAATTASENSYVASTTNSMGSAFSYASSSSFSLSSIAGRFKSVASGATSAFMAVRNFSNGIKNTLLPVNKLASSSFGRLLAAMKRIALYRLLRTTIKQITKAIREGINNLYQYSHAIGGVFAGSMDRLATSFQYLKNSLGAMAAPLINALAPAVDYLIDKFVALLNIINQFFAALTGASSWTKAKKQSASYGGAISSAGGAASQAAKDIKDATLGIDELNIISKDNGSGGGGGGGGGGAGGAVGDMFEEVQIDSRIKDFVDELKNYIKNGDWEGLGTMLGNKFNDVVDSIDFEGIGKKVGYALNAVITTSYHFLNTADFQKLGGGIAEFINGALSEIDTMTLGKLIARTITSGFDLAIGFIKKIDAKQLASKISGIVMGFFDHMSDWLDKVDWSDFGQTFAEKIVATFKGINWKGIAEKVGTFVSEGIGAVADTSGGLLVGFVNSLLESDWSFEKIGKGIKNVVSGKHSQQEGQNKQTMSKKKVSLGLATTKLKQEDFDNAYSDTMDKIAEAVKKAANKSKPKTEQAGKSVIENLFGGMKKGIVEKITHIKDWFTEIGDKVREAINGKKGLNENTGKTGAGKVISGIISTVKGASGGLLGVFSGLGADSTDSYNKGVDKSKNNSQPVMKSWGNVVASSFSGIVNKSTFEGYANNSTTGYNSKITSNSGSSKTPITSWANNIRSWFSGLVNSSFFSGNGSNSVSWYNSGVSSKDKKGNNSGVTTWGGHVLSWFKEKAGSGDFSSAGQSSVSGYNKGITNFQSTSKQYIQAWGGKILSWFKSKLGIKSPSRMFKGMADFTVEGYNEGISTYGKSTKAVVQNWVDSFTNIQPQMEYAFSVDTSSLDNYDPNKYVDNVHQTDVATHATMLTDGFKDSMEEFYTSYMQPTLEQMATDMRRQADKDESTDVYIGNRAITDAVEVQKKANGYSFTG